MGLFIFISIKFVLLKKFYYICNMKEFLQQKLREGLIKEERVKMDIPVPEDIRKIKDVFVKHGHKLFVVGGAVRDAILGKSPKDWDLATDAKPEKVERMMKIGGFKTLPTGKAFGVINVFTDDDEFEIATFRKDIGSGRRPDAVEFTTIDQDVKRRDLTINALFFDIDTSEVVDLVGGIKDLKNGIVRTVGAPEDRFGEDRLRILRAIRFAGRFGSELNPDVEAALKKDASLEGISGERIRDEFLKGVKTTKSVKHFMGLIDKFNLFDWVFPKLQVNKNFVEERDPLVQVASLLRDNDPNVLPKQLNTLKFPSDEIKAITFLIVLPQLTVDTAISLKKLQKQSKATDEQIRTFANMRGMDMNLLEKFLEFQLSVGGKEVMDKFNVKGPEVGKLIQKLETEKFKEFISK
jgi:tRNA nucleotidyltransferase/poly(A) polymerase